MTPSCVDGWPDPCFWRCMNKRLLSIVGVMALLAWTLGGVAAWALTKEGLHITVQELGQEDQGNDRLALLEDRIGGLQKDLAGLASTLGQNFEALQQNLSDDAGSGRAKLDARIDQLAREVANLREERRRTQELMTARSARMLTELDRIAEGQKAMAGPGASPGTMSGPITHAGNETTGSLDPTKIQAIQGTTGQSVGGKAVSEEPAAAEPQVEEPPTRETVAEAPVAAEVPQPAKASKKRSFLSFKLPSQTVAFDKRQHWKLIPSLSRVGFDGKSTLHDFSGVTSKLCGSLDVDLSHPEKEPKAEVQVQAAMLETGVEGRDEEMYTTLDTKSHPEIRFELISFTSKNVDAGAEKVVGVAHGRMTIHGVSKEVDMTTSLSLDASRRLHVDGEMPLDMTDYKITPPSKMGLVGMEKDVKVWIRLRARMEEAKQR